jgi:dethiobiotin synthetase
MRSIFITGIGTGIGKTVVSAIITQALEADYWKPVQAGTDEQTDTEWVQKVVGNKVTNVHAETYKLKLAASPHISARQEGVEIDTGKIFSHYKDISNNERRLIIEGAGGLMVPLNDHAFMIDLAEKLGSRLVLVSRNYLGSINHSLLTAALCRSRNIDVAGWIFNDQYMDYEEEIVRWSGYPRILSIPYLGNPEVYTITAQASLLKDKLVQFL